MKALKILLKIIKGLLIVLVLLVLAVVLVQRFSNNKTRIFGYGAYTVLTGSMEPEYGVGDILLSKEVKKEDIKVNDVLVYIGKEGDFTDKTVTHRVVSIDNKIHTKGDANDAEDPPIDYEQVQGRVVTKLRLLSLFSKLMNDSVLFYVLVFLPFGLLIFMDVKDIINDKNELQEKKNQEALKEEAEVVEEKETEVEIEQDKE